ncbi:DUF6907 domain-containing protein [Actinomadura opuntiae]|uniref:DUF6907 domain-containing protein n=1 Tax=Actinomadura sp. OS1-43 TaxID=604315 RepID=UPI00255B1D0A|nr:hypothetical protein [Actinomadura sp. OS1-43]MDL4815454.1 hypothetical protein [Actinomadura sp. OS1-43]
MQNPTARCAFPWCTGEHDTTTLFIRHRADVGTTSAQGEALTVSLRAEETHGGEPGLSAGVAVRWPHTAPYSEHGGEVDGLDVTADEADALAELLTRAAARLRGDQATGLPSDVGPYEDEQQAADTVREAYGDVTDLGTMGRFNKARLNAACMAAGVRLGAHDRRILAWLAGWEPETVAVVVGLVARAGRAAVDGRPEQSGEDGR